VASSCAAPRALVTDGHPADLVLITGVQDAGVVVHYRNDSRAMHALENTGERFMAAAATAVAAVVAVVAAAVAGAPSALAMLSSPRLCAITPTGPSPTHPTLTPTAYVLAPPYPPAAAVVVDRSHWGRLRLAGDDRLAFLHGQSTNDINALTPGTGCDTESRDTWRLLAASGDGSTRPCCTALSFGCNVPNYSTCPPPPMPAPHRRHAPLHLLQGCANS
jgi:hypothetical protein